MKIIFNVLIFLFAGYAHANVGAIFTADEATLIIQGNDTDASSLYAAMNVAPSNDGNKLTKHINYETMYAQPVFDLTCNESQLTKVFSCTLKFSSPGAVISKDQKWVLMGINDRIDSRHFAKLFNDVSSDHYRAEVFRSIDGTLHIWKTYDSTGGVVSFTISYN